jgi:tripartite-type tricarboxylate transporter receptor subunit TctC
VRRRAARGRRHDRHRRARPLAQIRSDRLLALAGTPADIIGRIQQTAKAQASPALKERLLGQGAIPSGMPPAAFGRFIVAESRKWTQVVKVSGAKVD